MEEEKKKKRNKKKKSKQNNHTNNNKASEDDVSVGAATNNNSNGQNEVIEVSSNGDVVDAEDFNGHYDKPNGAAPHSVRAQFFFSFFCKNFKTNLCARARLSND